MVHRRCRIQHWRGKLHDFQRKITFSTTGIVQYITRLSAARRNIQKMILKTRFTALCLLSVWHSKWLSGVEFQFNIALSMEGLEFSDTNHCGFFERPSESRPNLGAISVNKPVSSSSSSSSSCCCCCYVYRKNHFDLQPWARAVCTLPAVPRPTQPSTLRGTVNVYQLSG